MRTGRGNHRGKKDRPKRFIMWRRIYQIWLLETNCVQVNRLGHHVINFQIKKSERNSGKGRTICSMRRHGERKDTNPLSDPYNLYVQIHYKTNY